MGVVEGILGVAVIVGIVLLFDRGRRKLHQKSEEEGSKGAKAALAVGHTIGFVGRLLWTLVNWALGIILIVSVFMGWLDQWWAYILEPVLAILCIVNGFRCITGRSYWIFY
jgi:hypothetical protein